MFLHVLGPNPESPVASLIYKIRNGSVYPNQSLLGCVRSSFITKHICIHSYFIDILSLISTSWDHISSPLLLSQNSHVKQRENYIRAQRKLRKRHT
jgi:hypothetical protein